MTNKPDIRCTTCGREFVLSEISKSGSACPNCGADGVPMYIEDDRKITINIHELRILCMWADNYARSIDKEGDDNAKSVAGIVSRISKQIPNVAFTMGAEFHQLADEFGSDVIVTKDQGTEVIKPKDKGN